MSGPKKCECGKDVIWEDVLDAEPELFSLADTYGVPSLTEYEQMIYEGRVCADCIEAENN